MNLQKNADVVSKLLDNSACSAFAPLPTKRLKSKPIWVASFPGSGAELFRQLMTRLTDHPTVDSGESRSCHKGESVACKTHWPTIPRGFPNPSNHPKRLQNKVIVLVRNPVNAIPSWYNQIYEAKTNATFHSKQAPRKNWLRWSRGRYHHIEFKFKEWRDLILYWLQSPHYDVDLFVPYEQMVNPTTGPKLLAKVADTLQRSKISTIVPSQDITTFNATSSGTTIHCLWQDTVQRRATMKRAAHKYKPPYTSDQKSNMLALLDEFIDQIAILRDENDLLDVLNGYRRDIENNLLIEEE